MYAVLVAFQVFFSVSTGFSNSQIADARFPSLVACERGKQAVGRDAAQIAARVAGNFGARVQILSVRCVRP